MVWIPLLFITYTSLCTFFRKTVVEEGIPHAPTDTRVSGGNHIIGPYGENRHLLTPTVADEVYMAEFPPSVDLPLIGLEEV